MTLQLGRDVFPDAVHHAKEESIHPTAILELTVSQRVNSRDSTGR